MKVLVAEDDTTSLKMLELFLSKKGYQVIPVTNGDEALKILSDKNHPKLAIIDWIMPEYSGVEICRILNKRRENSFIYMILLTSKSEKENVVEGLDSGASDFLVKPVNLSELSSRLAVGMRIINYENAIKENSKQIELYASQMEHLAEERAKQLVHADRLATLGMMSAGIAHEINNPTSFISGNIQTLEKFWEHIKHSLETTIKQSNKDIDKKKFILQEMPDLIEGMKNGVSRITNIVKALNSYARQKSVNKELAHINKIISMALELCQNVLKYDIDIQKDFSENLPQINVDIQSLEQVFVNIFINAVHAMEKQKKKIIQIKTTSISNWIQIIVEDSGPGIPDSIIKKIWNPFFTSKEIGKSTGLGLSICQKIITIHGGKINVENSPDGGARFIIEIPIIGKG